MNLPVRAVAFLALSGAVWSTDVWLNETVLPTRSSAQSIAALNGGEKEVAYVRSIEHAKDAVTVGAAALTVGLFALCIGTYQGRPKVTYTSSEMK
jgi:hypothetical protein